MKNQKWFTFLVALFLIGGTAGALAWLRANQKLGLPGLRATPIPGTIMMKIPLPERVLDFDSTNIPEPELVSSYFPKDTSYSERIYRAPDGFRIQSTAILMGTDRTSIHRPEYCMPGQGWSIDQKTVVNIPIHDQPPYQLEVAKWKVSQIAQGPDGQNRKYAGVYVFWYAAHNEETANHDKMLEWMTLGLLRTGQLQRWAYMSYWSECEPGQEDATFERMKTFLAAQVPEFELPPESK